MNKELPMNDKEQLISRLSAASFAQPPGFVEFLKRAPRSLWWKLLIGRARLRREARGLMYRLQRRRIAHLLHIGKTGGTATKRALKGFERAGKYELMLHEHHFQLEHVPFGEKVIFFVRDPISRFISGFYGRQRQDRPRHDAPWTPGEEIAFSRFKSPNELALALSSDDPTRRDEAVHAIRNIDHLKAPHWTWFRNARYFRSRRADILLIGFQETLAEDFNSLKKILNLPDEVKLPEDDVNAHKNPANVDKTLDEQAIRNLKIWYARDYRFLELCREVASGIQSGLELSTEEYQNLSMSSCG